MYTLICLVSITLANPSVSPLHCPESAAAKGELKSGPALVHTFELINRGTGTITITKVEASCGCLHQSLTSGFLTPGETAKLTIEVNTLTQPEGKNRWQITVAYKVETPNLPNQTGDILLQIAASLTREIIINPPQLGFSTSTGASQTITLTDRRIKPLNIVKATTSSVHLSAEPAPRVDSPNGEHNQTVTVKLSEDAPAGHRDESIILQTDDPDYRELRIPVRVLKRIAGAVVASPESIAIRFSSDQSEVSTLVQLRRADGKPFSISSVEGDHPGVTVKSSKEIGSVGVVRITINESAAVQSGSCKVRVKIAETPDQDVEIPVKWVTEKKER